MARHWRMLLVPGFSDCSWAECDVDKGRPVTTRTLWSVLIYLWRGIFEPYMSPWVVHELGWRMPPLNR